MTVNGSYTYDPKLGTSDISEGTFSFAQGGGSGDSDEPGDVSNLGLGVKKRADQPINATVGGRKLNDPPYQIHNAHGPVSNHWPPVIDSRQV